MKSWAILHGWDKFLSLLDQTAVFLVKTDKVNVALGRA